MPVVEGRYETDSKVGVRDNPQSHVNNRLRGGYRGHAGAENLRAFPFTQYGVLPGQLATVSKDAVEQELTGWVFPVRISLGESVLDVQGREVALTPGMAISAEVSTGQRRIIDFVLSPLLKHFKESARER